MPKLWNKTFDCSCLAQVVSKKSVRISFDRKTCQIYVNSSYFIWKPNLDSANFPTTTTTCFPVKNLSTVDTAKRVAPPISFAFYCSATHVMSQVLQPKTVNKRYRGRRTFSSVFYDLIYLTDNTLSVLKHFKRFTNSDLMCCWLMDCFFICLHCQLRLRTGKMIQHDFSQPPLPVFLPKIYQLLWFNLTFR